MKTKIEEFLKSLNEKFPKDAPHKPYYDMEVARKYTKVYSVSQSGGRSAYAFIDNTTGDLFKPAGWKAPAKHARGNINDASGLKACGAYGVASLR